MWSGKECLLPGRNRELQLALVDACHGHESGCARVRGSARDRARGGVCRFRGARTSDPNGPGDGPEKRIACGCARARERGHAHARARGRAHRRRSVLHAICVHRDPGDPEFRAALALPLQPPAFLFHVDRFGAPFLPCS